ELHLHGRLLVMAEQNWSGFAMLPACELLAKLNGCCRQAFLLDQADPPHQVMKFRIRAQRIKGWLDFQLDKSAFPLFKGSLKRLDLFVLIPQPYLHGSDCR